MLCSSPVSGGMTGMTGMTGMLAQHLLTSVSPTPGILFPEGGVEAVRIPVCSRRPSAKNLARMARMLACSQHMVLFIFPSSVCVWIEMLTIFRDCFMYVVFVILSIHTFSTPFLSWSRLCVVRGTARAHRYRKKSQHRSQHIPQSLCWKSFSFH